MPETSQHDEIDVDTNHFDILFPSIASSQNNQYYDIDSFNSSFSINGMNDLSVIHLNIRSIAANGDRFAVFLSTLNLNFDVICLTETWVTELGLVDGFLEGYVCFHSFREARRGGGTAIYLKKHIHHTLVPHLTINNDVIESVFVKITKSNKNILIGCCYRPPSSNPDLFRIFLEQNLSTSSSNEDILVCGDFNHCMMRVNEDQSVSSFYHSMQSLSLIPTITKPTRITDTTSSLLDNILVTNLNNFNSGSLVVDISDHLPIFIVYKNYFQNEILTPQSFRYRMINESTLTEMYHALSRDALWEILDEDNVDIAMELLHSKILSNFDKCCPIKTKFISPKDNVKPWINNHVKQSIRNKESLYKLYLRKLISLREYNVMKNRVTNIIRQAKRKYYEDLFEALKTNMKKTWSTINNIMSPQINKNKSLIKNIIFNDVTYTESFDIANIFNQHFSTVGKTIDESIPIQPGNSDPLDYLSDVSIQNSFFFNPVSCNAVENIIRKLKNKPSHLSTYPISVIKYLSNLISPLICSIFNKSISTGQFPQILKTARVVPVYKSGSKTNINNFRPISILPIFGKIFEKIVHFQLYNYLDKLKILCSSQYGFRKKMSTSNAMTSMLQYIYNNLDRGHEVISLFLDFSKAFDCVKHEILLKKLHVYGVRGIANDWFRSYLTNRTQYTSVDGNNSICQPINYGVPQGSVLGPLLFLIFINDFPKCTNLFKFTLFADDSTLSCNFNNTPRDLIFNSIENELSKVNSWLTTNRIKINADKSKFICFSYRKTLQARPLKLGESFIQETQHTKFLGLILDRHLTFKNHIDHILSKISRSVGVLFKLNSFLPTNILKMLYNTLILPYLTYGVECWHAAPNYALDKLQVLQKKAVRAVFKLSYNEHTISYFKNNGLLKLNEIYRLNLSSHMYDVTNYATNLDILVRPITNSDVHNYNTRNRTNVSTPRYNRATTQSSFLYQSAKEWNSIPQIIKDCKSSASFKYNLRKFYCNQY